ncbi:SH3 domain-containing protein [Marinihelvus fidelis]|nr:SH3 domain-containing protein [Marinihelvus fidelis]
MRQTPEFWIDRCRAPDTVLMPPEAIEAFNRDAYARDPSLVDLAHFSRQLSAADVQARIEATSRRPAMALRHADGSEVTEADWQGYQAACNPGGVDDTVDVVFAMAHLRADMRTWPSADVVFRDEETRHLDRFQENTLFPGDVVAVLHRSQDGQWLFVQSHNYAAWVLVGSLATGDRADMLAWRDAPERVVVTAAFVDAQFNEPEHDRGALALEMGASLPICQGGEEGAGRWPVRLPVADSAGGLAFADAFLPATEGVRRGWLPYTRRHLVELAFRFLGEPYGWGHSRNARDCTGLVSEVYRAMGFVLPRNSAQQGHSPIGINTRFAEDATVAEKLEHIRGADVGDLLYSTGHVMMFLGLVDNEPWVIHDLAGAGWMDDEGQYHEREFSGVSVTPLVSLHMSRDVTYLDEMYAIKSIRAGVGES